MGAEKIVLVDDEQDILNFISYNLKKEGYEVFTALSGKEAIAIAKKEKPDLIVIDVMMPEMDGIETCQEIRAIDELKNTLITFLSARAEDYSQVAGFDAGADDYISKPIKPRLLVSKIKAILRRKSNGNTIENDKETGTENIRIDREKYLVYKGDETHSLPKKEFELLALLLSKPGKVFTREVILETIWGNDVVVGDRTIDVHIRKLRERLGDENIETIKGVGYKFKG